MSAKMKRREFITLLGGAAAAWPLTAHSQEPSRVRLIGILINVPVSEGQQASVAAFLKALRQLGWTEGRNLRIDIRWAEGRISEIRRHAAELVALTPDVILATGSARINPVYLRAGAGRRGWNSLLMTR
jgi:ABC-type uncharacterized transport system substrate-binding protein